MLGKISERKNIDEYLKKKIKLTKKEVRKTKQK